MRFTYSAVFVVGICFAAAGTAQIRMGSSATAVGETASELPSQPTGLQTQSPFAGSIPSGKATPEVLSLSLREAIERGLKFNLGVILGEQGTRLAQGRRIRALSKLLPTLTAQLLETGQQTNLKAFGFGGLPGINPIVGPFNVLDARAYVAQPVLDLNARHSAGAASENVKAAEYSYQDSRSLVVFAVTGLYLNAVSGSARIDAAQAQLNTAEALYKQAVDMKAAGVVPAIDVIRAQVEMQSQQQRLIFYQNEFEKEKLSVARAIGLALDQKFQLTEALPYSPAPAMTVEQALDEAYRSRADYMNSQALVRAAELERKAAAAEAYPTVSFNADYGAIGPRPNDSHGTFSVAGTVRIPVFQGGKVRGDVLQADALLEQQKSQTEDLRRRIEYEVRAAFLDLKAAARRVEVAQSALALANEQVTQAGDRFAAGVASNIEVVQAQEALASANENYISSLYTYNLAKASLARAVGLSEQAAQRLLGGKQ
jgi:outer membrane protein TolC